MNDPKFQIGDEVSVTRYPFKQGSVCAIQWQWGFNDGWGYQLEYGPDALSGGFVPEKSLKKVVPSMAVPVHILKEWRDYLVDWVDGTDELKDLIDDINVYLPTD